MVLLVRRLGRALKVPAVIEAYSTMSAGWTIPLLRLRAAPEDWNVLRWLWTRDPPCDPTRFRAEELVAAVDICRRKQSWAERDAPNRPSTEVSVALAHALGDGVVFASPGAEREWLEKTSAL
jgi:hypothetical protein